MSVVAHAIASAFIIIPQPAMDTAAPSGIPYVHGNTSSVNVDLYKGDKEKYRNIFQLDVPEVWYGTGFIRFLTDLLDSGAWEPKNHKVRVKAWCGVLYTVFTQTKRALTMLCRAGWKNAEQPAVIHFFL